MILNAILKPLKHILEFFHKIFLFSGTEVDDRAGVHTELEYYSYKKMFDYSEDFRNLKIFPNLLLQCQLKLEIFRDSGSPQSNRKIFL